MQSKQTLFIWMQALRLSDKRLKLLLCQTEGLGYSALRLLAGNSISTHAVTTMAMSATVWSNKHEQRGWLQSNSSQGQAMGTAACAAVALFSADCFQAHA